MIKKFWIVLIFVILLCGCTSDNIEEITFSSWGSVTEIEILNHIIEDFEKENPDIKVRFMHTPQNYFQKLHLLFASNTAPDVVFINNLHLPLYASHLCDLSSYINKNDFYMQAIESLSYNGKLYAVPRDVSNLVFYVNSDLMHLPNTDWTLPELLKMAQSVSGNGVWGVSYEDEMYFVLPYLAYFGENIEDVNIENAVGIRYYKDLQLKHHVAPTKSQIGSSTSAQMFLDKKLAMYLSGRWMYPKINERATFNWAIVPFPQGKNPLPCDASGWAISENSKHKASAIKFVQYLSSEKSAEYFATTGLIVPARIKASEKLNNSKHNEYVFIEVVNQSQANIVNKNYKKISDKIKLVL